MNFELPEHLIPIFNRHFEKANRLAGELIIIKDRSSKKIGFWEKRKVKKALAHYQKCLELIPDHWPSKWLSAKLYQATSEQLKALTLFKEAMQIEKSNPDIPREASISAINAGEIELAVKYSLEAIHRQPNDAGLFCNHAINLMVSGNDEEALNWMEKAIALDPDDPINQHAYSLIREVKNGTQRRPGFDEINLNLPNPTNYNE